MTRYAKGRNDFATDADVAAERAILAILAAARPEDRFIAEESGGTGEAAAARVWLIDPLCGTRNFATGTPHVAVNIAARVGSTITAAVVADPFAEEVFWTEGDGAWLRRDGLDSRLTPTVESRLVEVNLDYWVPGSGGFEPARLLGDPAFHADFGARVLSTTLAVGWVAAGRRAAYVSDGDLRDSVHFTSGIALCRAAGCVVTGLLGQPMDAPPYGVVAAADAETHAALVEIIAAQIGSENFSG
ncbi:myo-inositol-1(or 4)-monophosphatase [Nocardia tenerifensis]|uniref:Myo-inositol-1(Or 4)-monophosphatase n=2 Tax=Nocardia tenerifensis TaxID=228006 RepID=A0A318JUX3_9NOCA|nr:myo-inositol-1(or 4)-monophosphatase [Nocardia tenerifensis]